MVYGFRWWGYKQLGSNERIFLKKYQDYCRSRELKDEIFQMTARPNETLEEYVERFQYNLQRSPYASLPLPDNVLKTALIRGMKEQWIETLNIMGKGDIYQENFADIIDLCIRSSRGSTRIKPAEYDRFVRDNKISTEGVTRVELGNLLENFKTDILGTLTTQLDIVQAKQKQMEAEQNLAIFCPRCRKNIATRNVHWIQFKHVLSVQKITLLKAAPHFLD
jgi:hypothetical protein